MLLGRLSLRPSVYINVVLLINFPEQFELSFYFKYSRNYKVYNLGDKTLETDFLIQTYIHKFLQFTRVNLHAIDGM